MEPLHKATSRKRKFSVMSFTEEHPLKNYYVKKLKYLREQEIHDVVTSPDKIITNFEG